MTTRITRKIMFTALVALVVQELMALLLHSSPLKVSSILKRLSLACANIYIQMRSKHAIWLMCLLSQSKRLTLVLTKWLATVVEVEAVEEEDGVEVAVEAVEVVRLPPCIRLTM